MRPQTLVSVTLALLCSCDGGTTGPHVATASATEEHSKQSKPDDEPFKEAMDTPYSLDPPALQSKLPAALGMLIVCQAGLNECNRIGAEREFSFIPVDPYCGRYDCETSGSFSEHPDKQVINAKLARGTAAFVGPNLIMTAGHNYERSDTRNGSHTYFVMDKGHGQGWTLSKDKSHLKVSNSQILRISRWVAGTPSNTTVVPDWAVLEVERLDPKAALPDHETLCLDPNPVEAGADLLVPSHPRLLPLLMARGSVISPGHANAALTTFFDVAGGSSGAPLVRARQRLRMVGVHRGQVDGIENNGRPSHHSCSVPDSGHCYEQPATPIAMILASQQDLETVHICPQ